MKEVNVSIVAIFDGHGGAEASDMASKLLLEYYSVHVNFLLYEVYSSVMSTDFGRLVFVEEHSGTTPAVNVDEVESWSGSDSGRYKWTFPAILDDAFHLEILKKSLLKAVHDIDVTFSKEASRNSLVSGSTATIILIADGQVLTANLGDSKALLCSEKVRSTYEQRDYLFKLKRRIRDRSVPSYDKDYGKLMLANSDGRTYYAKELTKDHHPDRDDERNRIEAAGGNVVEWAGVVRVNGELAVSRSIGDIPFKIYGVISTPEVTDWHPLSTNDSYLVASSDGIFEKLTSQEVCDVLWDEKIRASMNSEFNFTVTHSLADIIIKAAFERGSMDNMSVVVLQLPLEGISGNFMKDGSALEGSSITSPFGLQRIIQENLGNLIPFGESTWISYNHPHDEL